MTTRSIGHKVLSLLLVAASAAACTSKAPAPVAPASSPASTAAPVNVSAVTNDMVAYDKGDAYTDWQNENPTYIALTGTPVVTGAGAAVTGNKVMVLSGGVFVFSGKLDDGQIIVDSQTKGTVRLVFNGMELHSKDSAPVYVKNADKTIITLADGTQNLVSDGQNYVYASSEDKPNAAIYSEDDLTINGTGSLTVKANFNNGIMGKDDLKVTGGNIAIQAVDDALVGRDMLLIKEGTFTIQAGGDGIKSTNDTDSAKGYIAIEGGTFDIRSGSDAVQAESSMLITGGNFTVITGGGSGSAPAKVPADPRQVGRPGAAPAPATTTTQTATDSKSSKGLKAKADIAISGGTFTIDSADDAIHSNNSIAITNGDITISSGDDGIHADASIEIAGGKINITKSYEGVESKVITFTGGETRLVASDDGVNVGGGADGSSVGGRPGQNSFSAAGSAALHIRGGYLEVDAMGDGLDANGAIYMSDGTVFVNGPTSSGNGALDYDATFEITGGLLVAAGSSGMAQAPATQSTQYSIGMTYSSAQAAGTPVSVKDSKGSELVTFTPKRQYQFVVISSPQLKKDATYTLYSGGTKVVSFPVSSVVTWLSEAGVTTGPARGMGPRR